MMFKFLVVVVFVVLFLIVCSLNLMKNNSDIIVFIEFELIVLFYVFNLFNYDVLFLFEINLKKVVVQFVIKMEVICFDDLFKKMVLDINKLIILIVNSKDCQLKFVVLVGDNEVDIIEIDDFLQLVEGKVCYYLLCFMEC